MKKIDILRDFSTPTKVLEIYASPSEMDFLSNREIGLILDHPNCTDSIRQMIEKHKSDKKKLLEDMGGKRGKDRDSLKKEETLVKNLERAKKAMMWTDLKKNSEGYIVKAIKNLYWVKSFGCFEFIDKMIMDKIKENPSEWPKLIEEVSILRRDKSLVSHNFGKTWNYWTGWNPTPMEVIVKNDEKRRL